MGEDTDVSDVVSVQELGLLFLMDKSFLPTTSKSFLQWASPGSSARRSDRRSARDGA